MLGKLRSSSSRRSRGSSASPPSLTDLSITDENEYVPNSQEEKEKPKKEEVKPKRSSLDTTAQMDAMYKLFTQFTGQTRPQPPPGNTPLRDDYRKMFAAASTLDKFETVASKKMLDTAELSMVREKSANDMRAFIDKFVVRVEHEREQAKRFAFDDAAQSEALNLMQIRYEELSMDDDDGSDASFGLLSPEKTSGSDGKDKYADVLENSEFNKQAFADVNRLWEKERENREAIARLKKERLGWKTELAQLDARLAEARRNCPQDAVIQEVLKTDAWKTLALQPSSQ